MQKKNEFPWWLIFIFTCFLSWLSLFIAGIITENRKWIIMGIVYAIPLFLIYTVDDNDSMRQEKQRIMRHLNENESFSPDDSLKYLVVIDMFEERQAISDSLRQLRKDKPENYQRTRDILTDKERNLRKEIDRSIEKANPELDENIWEDFVMGLWLISAIAAFAHALSIRKKYWELYHAKNDHKAISHRRKTQVKNQYMQETETIKKRIESKISKSGFLDSVIVSDILALTQTYTEQINRLVKDKERLENSAEIMQIAGLENDVRVLREKLKKEANPRLNREYKETIQTKEKLLESYKNLAVHRKATELRLEKAISSLKQIEYDLDRLNNAVDNTEQNRFFEDFKRKAEDLANYADELHKQMKETNI